MISGSLTAWAVPADFATHMMGGGLGLAAASPHALHRHVRADATKNAGANMCNLTVESLMPMMSATEVMN